MRFRMMILALFARGARGVKIAQARIAQTVDALQPIQHLLDQQFRFAVSIGGLQQRGLFDRRFFRRAIKSRRRGKDKSHYVVG